MSQNLDEGQNGALVSIQEHIEALAGQLQGLEDLYQSQRSLSQRTGAVSGNGEESMIKNLRILEKNIEALEQALAGPDFSSFTTSAAQHLGELRQRCESLRDAILAPRTVGGGELKRRSTTPSGYNSRSRLFTPTSESKVVTRMLSLEERLAMPPTPPCSVAQLNIIEEPSQGHELKDQGQRRRVRKLSGPSVTIPPAKKPPSSPPSSPRPLPSKGSPIKGMEKAVSPEDSESENPLPVSPHKLPPKASPIKSMVRATSREEAVAATPLSPPIKKVFSRGHLESGPPTPIIVPIVKAKSREEVLARMDLSVDGSKEELAQVKAAVTLFEEGVASNEGANEQAAMIRTLSLSAEDAAAAPVPAENHRTGEEGRGGGGNDGWRLYSWGRCDLGASLHATAAPARRGPGAHARVLGWRGGAGRRPAGVALSLYHCAAVTAAGEVLACGTNHAGQVRPGPRLHDGGGAGPGGDEEEEEDELISAPTLVEALLNQRAVQVAVGLEHTAAVTATGAVTTWGSDDAGRLGHGAPPPPAAAAGDGAAADSLGRRGPRAVVGLEGRRAVQVACAQLGTVALTAAGEVLTCGAAEVSGRATTENSYRMEPVVALGPAPVALVAAGAAHAAAVTVTGAAFAWGRNSHGQVGVELNLGGTVQTPQPLASKDIAVVACGGYHTVFISKEGVLFGCGRNNKGQLGPSLPKAVCPAAALPAGDGRRFAAAAAGDAHTLLLDGEGRLWGAGANAHGQVSETDAAACFELVPITLGGEPGEELEVLFLGAGGDGAAAVARAGAAAGGAPLRRTLTAQAAGAPMARMFSVAGGPGPLPSAADCLARLAGGDAAAAAAGAAAAAADRVLEVLFDPHLLGASFLAPHTESGLDVEGLERVYVQLLRGGGGGGGSAGGGGGKGERAQRLLRAVARGLDRLERMVAAAAAQAEAAGAEAAGAGEFFPAHRDALRPFLAYWLCPLLGAPALPGAADALLALCGAAIRLPPGARAALLRAAGEDAPPHLFAARLLRPLQDHLAHHLGVDHGRGRAVPSLALVLRWLHTLNEVKRLVPHTAFYNEAVSALPDQYLLQDFAGWKQARLAAAAAAAGGSPVAAAAGGGNRFFFCDYPCLLSADAKRRLITLEAQINQRHAGQQALAAGLMLGVGASPYLVLHVDRQHLLQSALTQILAFSDADLRKHLKVVFVGEEGVDEGGVRKEFFQLLVAELFRPDYGMFRPCGRGGRALWFNRDCDWADGEFHLVGVLLGLAIYNGSLLDARFPRVVYKKLLRADLTLEDLGDVDEELQQGFEQMLAYSGADVEDVYCRTWEVTWDGLGARRRHELVPGGRDLPVTAANKEAYVAAHVRWLLVGSVAPQFDPFLRGFLRVVRGAALALCAPPELERLVAGEPHLDFRALEAVAEYEGGYGKDHPAVRRFWEVVHGLPLEEQQRLLMFATGSPKAPLGGLGRLRFRVQRAGPDGDALPTAHTCFNTLLLPEYATAAKLRERLLVAVRECEGFGLQ